MSRRLATFVLTVIACAPADDDGDAGTGGDDAKPELGDTPLPECEGFVFALQQLESELVLPTPSAEFVRTQYVGTGIAGDEETPQGNATPLQRFVRAADAELGRVEDGVLIDDAAILADIEAGDPVALTDALWRIRTVVSLQVRARLFAVAEAQPEVDRDPALLYALWDEGYCLWDGALRPLAAQADALPDAPAYDGSWEDDMAAAFVDGHAGIESEEASYAVDPWVVKPEKQIAEKSTFALAERLAVSFARAARDGGDARQAAAARGAVRILEDRLLGRNTPAIASLDEMLTGDPALIDPDVVQREIAIAFVKRARKYADEAVALGVTGTADGLKGCYEGIIYTHAVLPLWVKLVPGTDPGAILSTWDAYKTAVTDDDIATANARSQELVAGNCALQAALGIPACTATDDAP